MDILQRIKEEQISPCKLFGTGINNIEKKIKCLIDIVMDDNPRDLGYDFFDIKGTVLLHGIPGIGKTTAMNNCMSYALDKYGSDCYEILTTETIECELGKATKNLSDALNEFESKENAILFIDEIDRLCINRKADELSELKRMLMELMRFFDRQKASSKRVILCCTNIVEQIDDALKRRFTIFEEVGKPEKKEMIEFANLCMEKASMKGKVIGIMQNLATFDDIKKVFRDALLANANVRDAFELEE